MEEHLTIGKVAKRAGVNIQTVLYYERIGLIHPIGRRESGYRIYSPDTIARIQFIKNSQELGFTLKEISGLLKLKVRSKAHCGDVKKKAEVKLKDVQSRIKKLESIERVLGDLIKTCKVQNKTDACPILKSLDIGR